MLAKIIVTDSDRDADRGENAARLDGTQLAGIETNLDYLGNSPLQMYFAAGGASTRVLESFRYAPRTSRLSVRTQTTIQDYPGRLIIGTWGCALRPMDSFVVSLGQPGGG